MEKWLCFAIAMLFLVPIGINGKEKEMNGNISIDNLNNENVIHHSDFISHLFYAKHHSIISNLIYRILIKMKNYPPVALIKEIHGIVGKPVVFDASPSYDPNGDRLYYRWDFDNDGVYDTKWLRNAKVEHVYYEPYDGYVKLKVSDDKGATDECVAKVIIKNAATTGEVDQKQEKVDGYVRVYEDKFFAQSFKPSKCGLDGIDLLVARKGIVSSGQENNAGKVVSKLMNLFARFFHKNNRFISALSETIRIKASKFSSIARTNSLFLGDLVVGIYGKLGDIYLDKEVRNSLVFETRIPPDRISRTVTWIHIDLDVELHWNKTYYIVVYQDGGNQYQYYKWYYGTGNPYENGSFYEEENYNWNWRENKDRDFCFRTYGYTSGEEPDGIEERWAVLFGCLESTGGIAMYADQDAYDMRDCLVAHGWDASHIKVLISPTKSQVKDAIEWLDSVDDSDDIDLVMWASHGGKSDSGYYIFTVKYDVVYGYEMDSWLDQCGAKGICVIADTCYAGWAIDDLAKDGRVILTSSDRQHKAGAWDPFQNHVFIYYLVDFSEGAFPKKSLDTNNDGWVSAEEAYPYAREKTNAFSWKYGGFYQNPLIYDGCEGDLRICYIG